MNCKKYIIISCFSALVLNLLKDFFERSKISFDRLRTSAGGDVQKLCFAFFLLVGLPLQAALAPYIPSYDDRYEDDMEQARGNKDYFKEPDDALNYAQYRYVGAHSAEKYPRFFPQAALQDQPIPGLLTAGVRGLMLTTFDWSLSWSSILKEGRSVVLSYPKQETTVFQKNGKPLYQTLHYEMNRIFNFLKSHPKAVITIIFEDYADSDKMDRDMREIIMKNSYDPILRPSQWSAAQQKGEWPTLGWMRKNNKRLIMFTQVNEQHTNFTWPENTYFWKNMTGTMNKDIACNEAQHDKPEPYNSHRLLVSFGCYGNPSLTPDKRNCLSYGSIKDLTTACKQKGFARGKLFNGYWADYIISVVNGLVKDKRKTVFDYVNELNVLKRK
jgi:hypothetical protein